MKGLRFAAFAVLGASSLLLAQQSEKPAPAPQGHVLFSGPPPQAQSTPAPTHAPSPADPVTDTLRRSLAIDAWDLDVHLTPRDQSMEAYARVTLRNDAAAPLSEIPLQLSSTLHFETIGLQGRRLTFRAFPLASDADHTGQLTEAVIALPQPLAPQASLTLDVDYGGSIPLSSGRLTAIGAPSAAAEASDWDRISASFTGLRGFGNVVWYPVISVPVTLGNGDTFFTEIGRQKLLDQNATAALRITDEFYSEPPTAVILDGHDVALAKPATMPTASFPGVITAALPATRLGFEAPSLFLTDNPETTGNGLRVLAPSADSASAQRYIAAAALVQPLVHAWLGKKDHPPATILDLPEPDDAPAETGDLLVTPLSTDDPSRLTPIVVHALAHAAFFSPRAWLNEGVASFLSTLWIESQQGQTAAMENLNADRPALAIAEPATPGTGSGQDLLHAFSAIYYRTKATYVLWMLRNLAGDKALEAALQAYNPAADTTPDYFQRILTPLASADLLSGHKDLNWFFQDWVYRDAGLPDLSIAAVYPSPEAHQQFLVAVDIVNAGYASALVPLTVKGYSASITDWVQVPAHTRITHRMTFSQNPTEVDLNDGSVPEVEDSIHRTTLNTTPAAGS
ncbi:MAG TPA: M1 family aminopeptidase [Acidobacteriaceae bacterium]|nr:M1 family aminopeptidase [Acidobacteriaceae bacterium]